MAVRVLIKTVAAAEAVGAVRSGSLNSNPIILPPRFRNMQHMKEHFGLYISHKADYASTSGFKHEV